MLMTDIGRIKDFWRYTILSDNVCVFIPTESTWTSKDVNITFV